MKLSTVTPAATGIDDGDRLSEQLRRRGQVVDVVEDADQGDQQRALEDRPRLGCPRAARSGRDENRREDLRARPASASALREASVVGQVDRPDPAGEAVGEWHQDEGEHPGDEESEEGVGVSRLLGIAIEPEVKRHQAPELPAQVLAARDWRRARRHRGRVEQPWRASAPRREDLAGEPLSGPRSQAASRDREALLAAAEDLLRQERRHGPPQQPLLGEAAHLGAGAGPSRSSATRCRGRAPAAPASGPCWCGRS